MELRIYQNGNIGYGYAMNVTTYLLMRKSGEIKIMDGGMIVNHIHAIKGRGAKAILNLMTQH